VLKHDLKTVFSTVIKNMGSTLGACGDVNRNVMGPAAPFVNKPEYMLAQKVRRGGLCKVLAYQHSCCNSAAVGRLLALGGWGWC
jgi:hypothetical protein